MVFQDGLIRFFRAAQRDLVDGKVVLTNFNLDHVFYGVGPDAEAAIWEGDILYRDDDGKYKLPAITCKWYLTCFEGCNKPLTKVVILWKQLCVMVLHFLFRISDTKL